MKKFTQCEHCGTPFSRTLWKKTAQGEYECFQCGNCYDVDAYEDENAARHQEAEDILSVPNLLNNLNFREAENRLEELEKKYPDNPKIYFLKVLAANCITYIPDESGKEVRHWVPTLNNINSEPLSSLSAYKKCLELAQGEEKEHFQKTFDFIEKKRAEVLEDYATGKYNYDVFISTKVTKLDFSNPAQPVPVTDASGDPLPTEDAKLASQIYDRLRHDNPKLRVFYSEREKDEMVGQRFENVIFSALHSAKVFILVASDINHVNWRWVKNEWMRYLYLMDPQEEGYKNRHIILAGNGLAKTELPFELKRREFVDFRRDAINGPLSLINFVNTSLQSSVAYERMTAKTFDTSVATINQDAIEATQMQTVALGAEVKEINVEVEEEARYWIKQTDDDEEAARWDAFRDLRNFVAQHPDAYAAKIHLLLDKTPFRNIDDYFSRCENVYNNPGIAKEFFNLAKKDDAISRLDSFGRLLSEAVNCYAEKDLGKLVKAAEVTVAPNLAYLSKERLKDVFGSYDKRVEHLSKEFKDLSFLSQYFDLHLFYTNKDPQKYIAKREKLLFRFEEPRIVRWIADSIIKVDPGNVTVLWSGITDALFETVLTPNEFITKFQMESPKLKDVIVGNKTLLDLFGKLFLYAPQADKSEYLYAFLLAIIAQDETYSYQGSDAQGDEGLSGYDLFKKYIGFDLSGVNARVPGQKDLPYYYKEIRIDAYGLKSATKLTPLDELLCRFGVELHKRGQFNLATDIYKMYLAQQSDVSFIDTLMIRYYQTLAGSGCVSPDDVAFSSQKFDCVAIGVALAKYDEKEYDDFRKFITHLERDRARYQAAYESLKKVFTTRPKAVLSALPALQEVEKEFLRQFQDLRDGGTSERIVAALRNDLSTEANTLHEEIKGLTDARAEINGIRKGKQTAKTVVENLYNRALTKHGARVYDPRVQSDVVADLDRYVSLYERWGDASDVVAAKEWHEEALTVLEAKNKAALGEFHAGVKTKKKAENKVKRRRRRAASARVFFLVIIPTLLCLCSLGAQFYLNYIGNLWKPVIEGDLGFWSIFDQGCTSWASSKFHFGFGHEGLLAIFTAPVFDRFGLYFTSFNDHYLLSLILLFVLVFAVLIIASWMGFAGKSRFVAVMTFIAIAPFAAYGLLLIIEGILLSLLNLGTGCYLLFGNSGCSGSCDQSNAWACWLFVGLAFLVGSAITVSGSLALFISGRYDD